MEAQEHQPEAARHDRGVEVLVNEHEVRLPDNRATGRQIKESAISQGVPIKLDFVLSEEQPKGPNRIIGDREVVTVTRCSSFQAVSPDDNS
jgi:hypothetical protein